MKERILTNWTFTRVIYVVMGVVVIVNSVQTHQLLGVLFGIYFASMGVFAFGCASGNCYTGFNPSNKKENTVEEHTTEHIEEVK